MTAAGPQKDDPGAPGGSQEIGVYLGLGLQLAVGVIVFYFIGRWVDEKLAVSPWGMIVGSGIGIVGGLIRFYRTVVDLEKQRSAKNSREG